MEKYRLLIEFLKMDAIYKNYNWNEEFEELYLQVKKETVSNFLITSEDYDIARYTKLKKYKIVPKDGVNRGWEFLVGPAKILFASNMQRIRDALLKGEKIQGLFTIKYSFFNRFIIPSAVIFLGESTERTWLTSVTSTEDIITLFNDRKHYSRKVYFTDALDPRNFMPEHYNDELRAVNKVLDNYKTRRLDDVADIILGKSVPSRFLTFKGIPYLRARNIQDGKIVGTDAYVPHELAKEYAKQLLQEGDILLSKNFGQHKIVKVTEDDIPAIASNGLFIIRAFDVPDDYLYQYMTSETGRKIFDKQLSGIEKGTTITSINLIDLRELRVPVFDEQTMCDFSDIDNLKATDLVRILDSMESSGYATDKYNKVPMGDRLELEVYNELRQAGWKEEEVIRGTRQLAIHVKKIDYIPDIVLFNEDEIIAVVEVKNNLSHVQPEILERLKEIIESGLVPSLILTTGNYYEIHISKNKLIKKMRTAPTKEELLSMISGEGV